jgi:DNA-binding XRE family transcriptional regulator
MAAGHDADRPALTLFAAELRAARQHAGLTRDELSAKVNYSSSLIGMIETGRRVPSRDLAERLDEVFGPDRARSPGWRPVCGTCPTRRRSCRLAYTRPERGRCGLSSTS